MKDIAIYKLARIEQAVDSLSRAIDRLELAALERAPLDPEHSAAEEALRREIEDLKADYENLRTVSQAVSTRLDSAIGRVRAVLET
ncbi:hypothetical protein [Pararhodospirillum photometricum]|uniref:hypothetical protein n=1 Tax=Pararhodospirillum photometricum TaxID=1084 RepID=UPI00030A8D98|nr:hypothetical protein [Pararhodospirillum photometricum]